MIITMYNYFNIGNTDKNDTQIHNDVKKFGLKAVLDQANNNIYAQTKNNIMNQ